MIEEDKISRKVLNKTFPFFFTVDYQLVVRDAGKGLLKVKSDIVQKSFEDVFTVIRPGVIDLSYKSLCESEDKVFLFSFKHLEEEVLFKAQVIILKGQRRILFVGSPFMRETGELSLLNLTLNDFSISDSTIDMLQILQVNKMVNDDMKELNRRLKQKEEKYRRLIEEAKEIIFTTDINGYFTYMNEVGINAIGLNEGDLLDTKFSDLMDKSYSDEIMSNVRRLLKQEISVSYVEFPLKAFDNLWIGQNMTVIEKGEKRIGFQGIGRDITEKINYERIIVKETEKAQIAAKEKSRFLANMSHEIRTPLNGIMGLTSLLLKTSISEKQNKYLNAINSSSETLMVVINDILDISKIDAGKLKISAHPFNIKTCITQLVEMMSAKAADKGVKLQYEELGTISDWLIGDEPRLNQILYNIVGNALKFTVKGGVKILISSEVTIDNIETIKIEVQDTGIGISEEKIGHIFKAFGQVDENDSRNFQGTGLGLTIASKLVKLHEGTISVSSELGVGSVFTVCIPYKIAANENISKVQSLGNLSNTYSFDNLKVLLAEDNPVNQMVTIDLLQNIGAQVDLAENGKIALEKMMTKDYDIILMDMQMPILDGYSTMVEIRKDLKYNQIPILALTAHVSDQEASKCKKMGANDYLSKPFKPSELFSKIELLTSVKGLSKEPKKVAKEEVESDVIVDFSLLFEFTNNNNKIILSTLNLLLDIVPKDISELQEAYSNKNYARIKAISHRAKPNFKLVCSKNFAGLFESLETLSKDSGNDDRIGGILKEVQESEQEILQGIRIQIEQLGVN